VRDAVHPVAARMSRGVGGWVYESHLPLGGGGGGGNTNMTAIEVDGGRLCACVSTQ
jgi:hypothetical protein